eukprot:TRINITY_DN6667_c0_g1_i1.p1 TRINITY_DN6667_c0_g1~~TRINITY_DN6667_c0_g1_i1.p1  ORF type:complete len:396 (+),score=50.88 TRINITY_DN6667_c0_g1_i1:99-1286(+)
MADADKNYTPMVFKGRPSLSSRPPPPRPSVNSKPSLPKPAEAEASSPALGLIEARPKASARELSELPGCVGGWLKKRGEHNRKLKLRWVMLVGGTCYYYLTPETAAPKGHFSLQHYTVHDTREKLDFSFKLTSPKRSRQWHFAAGSQDDADNWMKRFNKQLELFQRPPPSASATHLNPSDTVQRGASVSSFVSMRQDSDSDSSDDSDGYDDPYEDHIADHELNVNTMEDRTPKLPPRIAPSASDDSGPLSARPKSMAEPSDKPEPEPRGPSKSLTLPKRSNQSTLVPQGVPLQQTRFFVSGLDRSQAESVLKNEGVFLIRQRSPDSHYVLSVRWQSHIKHYKIFYVESIGYSLGGETEAKMFTNIVELVRHFQTHSLPQSHLKLGTPFDNRILGM